MNLWGSVCGAERLLKTLFVSLLLFYTCALDSKLELEAQNT